ncbi:MAG: hypothetical protein DI555_06570 [Novosphingobium pentaromativorans]|uniref:Bacteriophage tail tape measure N-terminal domain-containing protein n=1 Tax=Novosphingobium pentaromativorans TaxID=205844 RepID=A0A2W5QNN7_9SPHN|nr:MAG: hypothetical protein DI555_06570 [Novosphingobium pentaromativorans]
MAAKIGSLRADLTLETARFKAGAADAQAKMASLKNSITAGSREIRKAANDMGTSITGFSRQLADLKARLDPLAAAQAQYRQEIDLARKALSLGAITGKQYGQAMVEAGQKLSKFRSDLNALKEGAGTVTALSAEMVALKARLDPASAALAAYRNETKLLREAQREGVISTEQFVTGMKGATAAYRQSSAGVIAANGAARAGMQQLQFQINDVATMWAMGAKPMQIFASQAGQVVQAISLMNNGAGKFGKFMAGPWGLAITSAVIVLSTLIPKLLETDKAMKDVEMASSGLADAQSALGEIFDLTTGKLKSQNEMLRFNAQLMALNLRSQSISEAASSKKLLSAGGVNVSTTNQALSLLGKPILSNTYNAAQANMIAGRAAQIDPLKAGGIDALNKLLKDSERLNFDGLNVTQEDFRKAIVDRISSATKGLTADQIEASLKNNALDPAFRRDAPAKKLPKAPTMATDGQQDEEIAALNREYLQAKLSVTTDAAERAEIEDQMLAEERTRRLAEIDNNKKLTDAQKIERKAIIERIYGSDAANGDITVRNDPAHLKLKQERDARQVQLDNDMLSRQAETLQSMADIEPNTRKRAELEAKALEIQQEIQRNLLDQQIANGDIADADQARSELAKQQTSQRQRLAIQNMSPGQQYVYQLRTQVSNINDAIEGIKVDGIDSLINGFADATVGVRKFGDVFKNVAQQVISDLVRIQIRKAMVGALGNIFGGGLSLGGGSSNISSAGASYDFSAFTGISLGGARADGGPTAAGLPYLVGERGPEIFLPSSSGQVIPNHELANLGGGNGLGTQNNYYGPGADLFWSQVDQRAAGVAAPMSVASGVQARSAAGADMSRQARRRIP